MKENITENMMLVYLLEHAREYYKAFNRGHNEYHFEEVYIATQNIIKKIGTFSQKERLIMLTAAAYHDTGRCIDDERHEYYSCQIVRNDYNLKRWFDEDDIELICQIISEHRSKATASTIYAQILKDADSVCAVDPNRWLMRIIYHNVDQELPKTTVEDLADDIIKRLHILNTTHPKHFWCTDAAREIYGEKPIIPIPSKEEIIEMIKKESGL